MGVFSITRHHTNVKMLPKCPILPFFALDKLKFLCYHNSENVVEYYIRRHFHLFSARKLYLIIAKVTFSSRLFWRLKFAPNFGEIFMINRHFLPKIRVKNEFFGKVNTYNYLQVADFHS